MSFSKQQKTTSNASGGDDGDWLVLQALLYKIGLLNGKEARDEVQYFLG